MGMCCTRKAQDALNEEILDYKQNSFGTQRTEPEISQESDRSSIAISLSTLLTNLKDIITFPVRLFTFINLYNITIKYQENQTNSPYIIYDLRPTDKKIDNFLKKMKQINYSYDEMKVMSNDKQKNLKRYLNNKAIMFILPNDNTDLLRNIFAFITEINLDVSVYVLNINLSPLLLSPYSHRLYHSLDDRHYSDYPYVLMPYKHLKHFNNDGFVFFINHSINNFTKEYLSRPDNEKDPLLVFWKGFKITAIIKGTPHEDEVNNNQEEFIEFTIGEERCRQALFSFKDNKRNIDNITNICFWLKKQAAKGNSFLIVIENNATIDQYLPFVIVILWKVTLVHPIRIMEYISDDVVKFLDDCKRYIEQNANAILNLLKRFGFEDVRL